MRKGDVLAVSASRPRRPQLSAARGLSICLIRNGPARSRGEELITALATPEVADRPFQLAFPCLDAAFAVSRVPYMFGTSINALRTDGPPA